MKTKYLLFIIVLMTVVVFIFWPAKYKTINHSGWDINADSFMNTGEYYFMCKPQNGYLIKKKKPKLDVSNKEINTDNIINVEVRKRINRFIKKNPSWYDMVEYKSTRLMDTDVLSSDIYTVNLSKKEYLLIKDYKYKKFSNKKKSISVIWLEENKDNRKEEFLTYDKLVMLAQQRCREQGIDE
ncbi:hypothetical protein [Aliivibrio fischeri]|uniref:Uncharacterized protein n=1 Tax=Aliivibrio fischeri TaxID=668 RepID=A0A844P1J8_ALIFS|nr:hypothetical protein [Aliivibrio fischeri]MUK49254.1 hypothetical protein [Aliivibrio fischeri]